MITGIRFQINAALNDLRKSENFVVSV